ncbi:MAG: M23 family metallopeptidase [Ruminococcus sp.]|nr:M23 family metallopeptidase [Ruminococcus sp.]
MSRDRENSGAKQRGKFSERPRNSPLTEHFDRTEDTVSPSGSISQQRRFASLRQTPEIENNTTDSMDLSAQQLQDNSQRQEETESIVSEQPVYPTESRRTESVMQNSSRYRQKFRQEARSAETGAGASKLRFADDELPGQDAVNRKLEKAQERAARFEQRLHKAENKLPSRRKPRLETSADPATGKPKTRLRFEKEVKEKSEALKGSTALRPMKGAANLAAGMVHKQIYKNEHENVGVQAAHRAEIAGETGLRCASRAHKLAPYNKVKRLQNRTVNAQAKAAYQKALAENPELKKKKLAKAMYKKQLKRKYAKAAREAQKKGKRAKKTAVTTEKIVKEIAGAIKRHPVAALVIFLIFLLILFIASAFTSCTSIGAGSSGAFSSVSYLADDNVIDQAELTYTEWETDLQLEINRMETIRSGYDEYRYDVDEIGHDPHVLMAYLTAVYGDFNSSQAESAMRSLFDSQYHLTLTEEVERRTRTEPATDPTTHQQTTTNVAYDYKILNVKLTSVSLESIVSGRVNSEQRETCDTLLTTKGCRQYVKNVFGSTNWLSSVTSYYGYRVHPVSGVKDYHTGVDIGVPQGTVIRAGHDGVVTVAGNSGGYGLCVIIEGDTPTGKTLMTRYGHCSQLLVAAGANVHAGDVIAKVGSTGASTGPHLHLEVLLDGHYLNPLYYAETGDETERHL